MKNNSSISDNEIKLYLCNALPADRRKVVREWFATEEGQYCLSHTIDKDIARVLLGEELISTEKIKLPQVPYTPQKSPSKLNLALRYMRYAAIWISVISTVSMLSYVLYSYTFQENQLIVEVPKGEMQTVIFQDGTKVTLNADSKLTYSSTFNLFKREVSLEGEAYFNVSKNRFKPFIVKTDDINVKVLGTKFNVKAYRDENEIITTLTEGHIRFIPNYGASMDLVPGEQVKYNKENKNASKITVANAVDFISWKNNELYFEEQRLDYIVKVLSRKFNKEIVIADRTLDSAIYTIGFSQMKLDDILKDIETISPVSCRKENNKIYIRKSRK